MKQLNNRFTILFWLLSLMLTSSFLVDAQETSPEIHYYYIEEASYDLLKPTNIVTKEDRTLKLEFENQNLTDFFATLDIHLYNREFEWSENTYLHRYYVIGLERDDLVNNLESINEIVFAEYIGDLEAELLETPNDYFNHGFIQNRLVNDFPGDQHVNVTNNKKAFEHLELINARQAWNITKGSSDIAVGVVDGALNIGHPDLDDKIMQHYGAVWTGGNGNQHGTQVAGAVAADTDNGIGISSIGYNISLVTAPMNPDSNIHNLPQVTTREGMALYMVENNPEIKVLNFSWITLQGYSATAEEVYDLIVENNGVAIVAAVGNQPWAGGAPASNQSYPASYENVITVSSVSSYNDYGHVDENGQEWGWKDVHEFFIGDTMTTHQRHDKVDLVAPGHLVPAPNRFDEYRLSTGTSYASPIVAGTIALMYDVHPDITPTKVKDILKATADTIYHIPENEKYRGRLGSGRLNAYAAVLTAKCEFTQEPGLDLIMRNSEDDYGEEPDTATDVIWDSPDIWVRNQPDGQLYKQNEVLNYVDENTPVYVYVRVTNDSCEETNGEDTLELYWAKGGASQPWPSAWNGSTVNAGLEFGNEVDQLPVPELKPGKSVIIEFEWFPKDPIDYENLDFVNNASMFCFLARIDSADDPMTTPEVENAALNTRNNNNIAYKNATVINVSERPDRGSMVVGNLGGSSGIVSSLEFFTNTDQDDYLWQDAEVYVQLNQNLWDIWQNSGGQFTDVRIIDSNEYLIRVDSNHASLENIYFQSDDWGVATMGVNFLINEVDAQEDYTLHVQQSEFTTQDVLGGFSYTFHRDNQRPYFNALIDENENIDGTSTYYAEDINEDAIYNWYDEDGELIYSGSSLTVSNTIAKEYELEITAEVDGHKDYKTIESEDKRKITSISPNPSSGSTMIAYLIGEEDNAALQFTHSVYASNYNYVLNNQESELALTTVGWTTGLYVVNLVVNGIIIDTKNLLIN